MQAESQIGHFSEMKNLCYYKQKISHNALFISHNATLCDVIWVFKFWIEILKHKMLDFFLGLEGLWLLTMLHLINNAINYVLQF